MAIAPTSAFLVLVMFWLHAPQPIGQVSTLLTFEMEWLFFETEIFLHYDVIQSSDRNLLNET